MIELHTVAAYHGPSPVAGDPVVVVEMLAAAESYGRLVGAIRELGSVTADWYVDAGEPSGEVSPVQRVGDFLAGWALQALTYVNGYLHSCGCVTDPGSARALVWVGFHDPQVSLAALDLGARWLAALAAGRPEAEDWPDLLDQLWTRCRQAHPDYQARIVMAAARARGVPYAPAWGLYRHWRFGQGVRSRVLFESSPCDDGRMGSRIAESKALSSQTLRSLGIPVPASAFIEQDSEVEQAVAEVGFPCVTKPIDLTGGKGVTCGLTTAAAVRDGFAAARAHSSGPVLVESHVDGEDHRLMVVDGRLAAAMRREAPTVTGDGRRTIAELVAEKNSGRDARSLVRSGYLRPIALDASALLHLAGLGMTPETVLAQGESVRVRSNANLSTGGDCVDVTALVHPTVRVLAESIARTLNLAVAGVDLVTTDIGMSLADSGGRFIEVNTAPGLEVPIVAGWTTERAGDLALGLTPGRIPVRLVVVADDAEHRALEAVRSWQWANGRGWAGWAGAGHAGAELSVQRGPAWAGVQTLLGHRNLARGLVIATAGQIYEYGLPQDRFLSAHVACDLNPLWRTALQKCSDDVVAVDPADPLGGLHDTLTALG